VGALSIWASVSPVSTNQNVPLNLLRKSLLSSVRRVTKSVKYLTVTEITKISDNIRTLSAEQISGHGTTAKPLKIKPRPVTGLANTSGNYAPEKQQKTQAKPRAKSRPSSLTEYK